MRKASKIILFILLTMLSFFLFQVVETYQYLSSIRFTLNDNFSISLPKPKHEIKVLSDINSMPVDGKAFSVLEYDEGSTEKLKKFSQWKSIDNNGKKEVNNFVEELKRYSLMENPEGAMINKYAPRIREKTLYYIKPYKNDYAMLIFNEDEKRIYVLENIDRTMKYSLTLKINR